jgi:hypothetical protein
MITDLATAGQIIRPDAWCWESVTNAWRHGNDFVLEQARSWNKHGYNATILLQDNAFLGVPQHRKRMFLIAHRHPLVWPKLTQPMTIREAFARIPSNLPAPPIQMKELTPIWKRLWEISAKHKGRLRDAYNSVYASKPDKIGTIPLNTVMRLNPDRPAPVMLASFMRLHPDEPRMLNWYEWLALTGLPWDWQTSQRHDDPASRELARAVMPGVGQWLGTAVKNGLKCAPESKITTRLVDMINPELERSEILWTDRIVKRPPRHVWDPLPPPAKPTAKLRAPSSSHYVPRPRGLGIGQRIRDMIESGADTQSILTTIHQEFPTSKATAADVSWNKRKLRLMKEAGNVV